MHMKEKPTRVWIFPVDDEPRLLPEEIISEAFIQYDETGWEPSLAFLYNQIVCKTVERVIHPLGDLWVDEGGRFQDPCFVNPTASELTKQPTVGRAVLIVRPGIESPTDTHQVFRAFWAFIAREKPPFGGLEIPTLR